MLPRWHLALGALFVVVIWLFYPQTDLFLLGLVLFASVFIDFDHYVNAVKNNKSLSLIRAFDYHKIKGKEELLENKKGIRRKGDFHVFHTVEFHVLIGLLGFLWVGFFYLFIGMIFHSMLDIFSLLYGDRMYRREYFLFNWMFLKQN